MSQTDDPSDTSVASHTLVLLRRLDQRQAQLSDLVIRQQDLIGRLERDMREGFAIVQRDIRELRSDMVLMENRILSAMSGHLELASRLDEHDERIGSLERRASTNV